nr:response regulator transcription factor [Ardenticatena sp.]
MKTYHVLLVDDHPVVRTGISQILKAENVFEIYEADHGEEAWHLLQTQPFDLLLLDLRMPRLNGLDLVRRLRTMYRMPPIIILSAFADAAQALTLFRHGIRGYILKDEATTTICDAIRTVLSGDLWVSPRLAARLYQHHSMPSIRLSEREREVLLHLARGWSNRRIAEALHITENTVRNHVAAIFNKTGATSRVAAVILALKYGEITLDDIAIGD